jgi:predicted RNA-binding Zn-ribbon protein involved in translation (DUF1610 family)
MSAGVYRLGTPEASEALLRDLYIELRAKIRRWAAATKQTAQARMGYVGQHLVSVVTGYEGGRSGARGRDLIVPPDSYAEIKTCYRVDQLGKCLDCGAAVASIEDACPKCGSAKIERHEDSKWLISFHDEEDFKEFLDPKWYFLALFDFAKPGRVDVIQASIWRVDPLCPGFGLCLVDYRYNIQAKSKSGAPFNLWPYLPKFDLMRPLLIYRAQIRADDSIQTLKFPGRDQPEPTFAKALREYARSRNIAGINVPALASEIGMPSAPLGGSRAANLEAIERYADGKRISRSDFTDAVARAVYGDAVRPRLPQLPRELTAKVSKMLTP